MKRISVLLLAILLAGCAAGDYRVLKVYDGDRERDDARRPGAARRDGDPDAPEASREAAIEQIEACWAANLDKYDHGEPKLPLSPEDRATMRELGGAGTAAMP